MEIRPIKIEDFENGFLETLASLHPVNLSIPEAIKIWKNLPSNILIFVADIDEQVVGTATLLIEQKFIHAASRCAHIEDVATHRSHQGKGIGSLLQKRLIEEAKVHDCYKIILDCNPELVPFYKKFGYKESTKHMRKNIKDIYGKFIEEK